jgi:hypothetical protein
MVRVVEQRNNTTTNKQAHNFEDKWARLVLCVDVESNLECCCVLQK